MGLSGVNGVFLGKPKVKRPLGRPRSKCLYNIRMDHWGEASVWCVGGEIGRKETAGET